MNKKNNSGIFWIVLAVLLAVSAMVLSIMPYIARELDKPEDTKDAWVTEAPDDTVFPGDTTDTNVPGDTTLPNDTDLPVGDDPDVVPPADTEDPSGSDTTDPDDGPTVTDTVNATVIFDDLTDGQCTDYEFIISYTNSKGEEVKITHVSDNDDYLNNPTFELVDIASPLTVYYDAGGVNVYYNDELVYNNFTEGSAFDDPKYTFENVENGAVIKVEGAYL